MLCRSKAASIDGSGLYVLILLFLNNQNQFMNRVKVLIVGQPGLKTFAMKVNPSWEPRNGLWTKPATGLAVAFGCQPRVPGRSRVRGDS